MFKVISLDWQQGEVTSNNNGTYSLQYTLASAGNHSLDMLVNGSPLQQDGVRLTAEYGPLLAAECCAYIERSADNSTDDATCGTSQAIFIEVHPQLLPLHTLWVLF